jgi:hypothetical protein
MQHVLGTGAVHTWCWWENLKERDHLEDLGLNGRTILKWDFEKYFGNVDWIYVTQGGQVVRCCECGNEPSVFTRNCYLLKKNFAPCS